jgi:hypothetical protein
VIPKDEVLVNRTPLRSPAINRSRSLGHEHELAITAVGVLEVLGRKL